ncbi:hypothetical protein J6590_094089 [Homalodisca vitripennis]|nr:hypothetical protein J6590_094089 [Homalodisca vitripennis]
MLYLNAKWKNPQLAHHSLTNRKGNINCDSSSPLAGLVQQRRTAKTRVSSINKPGARLPQIDCSDPRTPDSCSVLIAGANDIAA